MPSLRVLCVVLLAGLGATAAGLASTSAPDTGPQRRAALTSDSSPQARSTAKPAGRSAVTGFDARPENARPGSASWPISRERGEAPGLGAYADAISVRAGERVPLHVSGAGSVRVRALRIGWYGGTGARTVWERSFESSSASSASSARSAASQPDPASWPAIGVADTTNWPPGQYLLRLDLGRASRYVPLTVRSRTAGGRLLLVTSPLTWQAENGPTPAGPLARSYDRPYAQGYGAGGFLAGDASIIQLAERDGRQLAYTTDLDLARDPSALDGATAVVFGAASTYWPAELRTAVIAAIHQGTNAAFFGAGTGTRRVQLSSDGRSMTVQRSIPPASPALTGLRPVCSPGTAGSGTGSTGDGAWVVQHPSWWGYAAAGVTAGQVLPGLVSAEPDGRPEPVRESTGKPALTVVAQSEVGCADGTAAAGPQAAAYWTDPSGAGVFTTGTSRWACVSGGTCPVGTAVPAATRSMAAQVTRTVLVAFASPRAGRTHRAG